MLEQAKISEFVFTIFIFWTPTASFCEFSLTLMNETWVNHKEGCHMHNRVYQILQMDENLIDVVL
jgi:hypothetical protein